MRRLKLAFTLTEALLAMAIVGIIASITIPQVVKNLNKNQTGMILARAVQQIELGNQNMIQMVNDSYDDGSMIDTLNPIRFSDLNFTNPLLNIQQTSILTVPLFAEAASPYWGLTPNNIASTNISNGGIKNLDGTEADDTATQNLLTDSQNVNRLYVLRRNFKDIPASIGVSQSFAGGRDFEFDEVISSISIIIDTNTFAKAPNTYGKDIFRFNLQNSGKLVPEGDETESFIKNGYKFD